MIDYYILDGRKAVLCADPMQWIDWMRENPDACRVALTHIGTYTVSTVFLARTIPDEDGTASELFETMIFGGALDREHQRCATWEQATKQHAAACHRVTAVVTCES